MKNQAYADRDDTPKLHVGPVPGDIIKPVVAEVPSYDRVMELLAKRYRAIIYEDDIKASLNKATLNEAVEFALQSHVKYDGHERNVIFSEKELADKRRAVNMTGLIGSISSSIVSSPSKKDIAIAFNRQMAMRKLTMMPGYLLDRLLTRLEDQGFVETKYTMGIKQYFPKAGKKVQPTDLEALFKDIDLS